ncbi:unnamed protein product, partial [marine sediment metagenome]
HSTCADPLALTLPLLELTHGDAWGGPTPPGSAAPLRFIVVFRHGGTATNVHRYKINTPGEKLDGTGSEQGTSLWAPKSAGEALVLGPIHSILESHKDKLLVLTGVDNAAGVIQSPYDGEHGWANRTILTSAKAVESPDGKGGTSILAQGPS